MKAYMSDRVDRTIHIIDHGRRAETWEPFTDPFCAEREARRILAETEPQAGPWTHPSIGYFAVSPLQFHDMRGALMESLAAFITTEEM